MVKEIHYSAKNSPSGVTVVVVSGNRYGLVERSAATGGELFAIPTRALKTTTVINSHMDQNAEKPKKKWYLRWWMFVIYAVLVLFVIGSLGGSKGSSTTPAQTVQQVAPTPALTVTAFQMASDYKDNQVAADAKYKDKLVQISGTVDTIGEDALDTPYIAFATENQYDVINRIQCMFGKNDSAALSNVTKGQKIILQGTVSGMLGNIIVNDCQIVQ